MLRQIEILKPLCDAGEVADLFGRRITAWILLRGQQLPALARCGVHVDGFTSVSIGGKPMTIGQWIQVGQTFEYADASWRSTAIKIGVSCNIEGEWEGEMYVDDFRIE